MTINIHVGGTQGIIVARDVMGDMIGGTVLHDLSDDALIVVLDDELDGVIEALLQVKAQLEESK